MGLKTRNLEMLKQHDINVHNFKEISNYEDLLSYSDSHPRFSMRFDSTDNIKGLPFYTYDAKKIEDKESFFKMIINEMQQLKCTLLCSDGYAYDAILKFNFVIEIDSNHNFILELCDKKVPLREMYQYKTTVIRGNVFEKHYTYLNTEENKYQDDEIDQIIDYVVHHQCQYSEGTYYEQKVGNLKQNIVIWETNR